MELNHQWKNSNSSSPPRASVMAPLQCSEIVQETDAVAAANLFKKQTQWLQQTCSRNRRSGCSKPVQETDAVAAANLFTK